MDDELRQFPVILKKLEQFHLTTDGDVHEDGLRMLRETLVHAFVEVSFPAQYESLFFGQLNASYVGTAQYEPLCFYGSI